MSAPTTQPPAYQSARDTGVQRFGVLVISPDPARRAQLVALAQARGARRVIDYATATEAKARARIETPLDLCIIDGSTNDLPILPFVRQMKVFGWRRIILVTARHDAYGVMAALRVGIRGFVVMPTSSRSRPIAGPRPVHPGLSDREIQVLAAVAAGQSNKAVGEELGLSGLTVKSHLARIARKLGTGDRAEMVAIAMRTRAIS